ncbi:MAG: endonuclease VII domain-containing protein [Chitinophagales bacterium]|nr:Hpy99I family type II restriction endonuclease [Bacteroidota bacterium]MCB9044283.1 Hpy99I family type II restriction endonuclease [Chitinophagales bacterium]
MIKIEDFVISRKSGISVPINAVGVVREIDAINQIAVVFFIGKRINLTLSLEDIDYLDVTKTGKTHKYKICNVCHILKKDLEDFDVNQTDAKGRKTTRPSCKECRKSIDGIPLKLNEKNRLDAIKPKHFFICPICEKGSIPGVTANFVKDHDHNTGNGREWICDSCNTGLGRFKDDISLLQKAIKYLKKHNPI